MKATSERDSGPLVSAGLGCALVATAAAAGALLSETRGDIWAPVGLGGISLLAGLLPALGVRTRVASLALAWSWVLGTLVMILDLEALDRPHVGLTAIGPLLALALVGRREALAAGGVAIGALSALVGAQLYFSSPPVGAISPSIDGLFGPLAVTSTLVLAYVAATVRTQVTARTRNSAHRVSALLDALPDTVLRLDASGRIIDAQWAPPLRPPDRWQGLHLGDLAPELRGLAARLATETATDPVTVHLPSDRGGFDIEVRAQRRHQGELVLFLRDVSRQREAERRLRKRQEDDRQAERMSQTHVLQAGRLAHMGVLATGVAHEINNPLAYVLSNLEYVIAGFDARDPPPDLREALVEATEGARRIKDIVEDIRLFSRADDSDHLELAQLADVARSAVRVVRSELRQRVRLTEDHLAAPPVFANPSRLAQVIVNLLVNAIQSVPEDRDQPGHIVLRTGTAPTGEAFVEVIDDGVGIHEEHQRRVFEPFFTTRPIGQGSGLGLSICYGLVRRLGGEVDVESELGRGSTFRIRLPDGQVLLDAC